MGNSDLIQRLRVDMHAYGICQKAADALEAAEAEAARLREALAEIEREAGTHTVAIGQQTGMARVYKIARAALKEAKHE